MCYRQSEMSSVAHQWRRGTRRLWYGHLIFEIPAVVKSFVNFLPCRWHVNCKFVCVRSFVRWEIIMCSLQIEVIRGTSACTRTSLQFRAIKRFVSSKHGCFPSYLYSFSKYALLGYFQSEVNNLAQRDLLVKRNSLFCTVRALIVKRKYFFLSA